MLAVCVQTRGSVGIRRRSVPDLFLAKKPYGPCSRVPGARPISRTPKARMIDMTEQSPVFRPPRAGDRVRVSVRASIGSPVEAYWIVYRAALNQWDTGPADDQTGQPADVGKQHYPRAATPGRVRGARRARRAMGLISSYERTRPA